MKAKLKMLKRIRAARERIRDAAAAEFAVVDAQRKAREDDRVRANEERQEIVNESDNRLKIAMHVAEIEALGVEIRSADSCIGEAGVALEEASERSREAAGVLRGCERALRLSERLVSDTRKEIGRAANKDEQAMVDDIIASRWSKS